MSIDTAPSGEDAAGGDEAAIVYSQQLGDRLRRLRKQQRLSLFDVEQQSNQEFKASVLGAYERGERVVSVPRLDRLARFYGIPVEQLLRRETGAPASTPVPDGADVRLTIDVAKLARLPGPSFEALTRYLRSIQAQRQVFGVDVVTVRRDDVCSIAAMLAVSTGLVTARLAELGVLAADAG
jgi:transcriptional regulator with XRE-family HTH domain